MFLTYSVLWPTLLLLLIFVQLVSFVWFYSGHFHIGFYES